MNLASLGQVNEVNCFSYLREVKWLKNLLSQLNSFVENFSENYLERSITLRHVEMGFDLGTENLKCAMVEKGTNRIAGLLHTRLVPERTSRNEKIHKNELRDKFRELSRGLMKKYAGNPLEICSSIQGEGTVNQYLEFPALSKKEIPLAVEAKAMKNIPFPAEKIKLDFLLVPPLGDKKNKTAVFAAAAHQDSLEEYINLITDCGFKVKSLETPILPLVREFRWNHPDAGDAPVMLVHSGFRLTLVAVLINGYPYYSREFNIAGGDFTYAFQMAFQSSWDEAEEYKISYDAIKRDATLEPFIVRWLDEIHKSWSYFKSSFPQVTEPLSRIYFSGGNSRMMNLDRILEEKMGVPVEIDSWSKIRKINRNIKQEPCLYKIAVGLTLR